MSTDILEDLSRFNEEFVPAATRRANLEALANGSYTFDIVEADLARTDKSREPILRIVLKVVSGPAEKDLTVEHVYFFRTIDNANRVGGDMKALGFPADKWAGAFSVELGKAVPRLKGIRFRGTKQSSAKDGKTYHNLNVDGKIGGGGPPPPSVPASQPSPPPPKSGGEEVIPF